MPGLLRGQMLQVALDLGQEGVQHVQDRDQQGVVGDGGPPLTESRGVSGHLQELSRTERQSESRGVDRGVTRGPPWGWGWGDGLVRGELGDGGSVGGSGHGAPGGWMRTRH